MFAIYRPDALAGTRALGCTFHAPAPPYVTHVSRRREIAERIHTALFQAFEAPDLETTRSALFLQGTNGLDLDSYEKILDFETSAANLGYPDLR